MVLHIDSSSEYILSQQYENANLPKGAANHVLGVQDKHVCEQLAGKLVQYKQVYPVSLPKMLPPLHGLGDKYIVILENGTKSVSISPYRSNTTRISLNTILGIANSGCIRASNSLYASPIVLARKLGGSLYFFMDYQ